MAIKSIPLNPQYTATVHYEVVTDSTEEQTTNTHDVVVDAGHRFDDSKRDRQGLSPVSLGSGQVISQEGLKDPC